MFGVLGCQPVPAVQAAPSPTAAPTAAPTPLPSPTAQPAPSPVATPAAATTAPSVVAQLRRDYLTAQVWSFVVAEPAGGTISAASAIDAVGRTLIQLSGAPTRTTTSYGRFGSCGRPADRDVWLVVLEGVTPVMPSSFPTLPPDPSPRTYFFVDAHSGQEFISFPISFAMGCE